MFQKMLSSLYLKLEKVFFNSLHSIFLDEKGLDFLDMFGGSGLMSLEAISRGYNATTIERDKKTFEAIKSNFKKLNVKGNIIFSDSMKYLKNDEKKYDVIYIDPPWTNPDFEYSYNDILHLALSRLNIDGVVIFESEKRKKLLHQDFSSLYDEKLIREKVYGRCLLSFFKNQTSLVESAPDELE